jgi:hypothetical protein
MQILFTLFFSLVLLSCESNASPDFSKQQLLFQKFISYKELVIVCSYPDKTIRVNKFQISSDSSYLYYGSILDEGRKKGRVGDSFFIAKQVPLDTATKLVPLLKQANIMCVEYLDGDTTRPIVNMLGAGTTIFSNQGITVLPESSKVVLPFKGEPILRKNGWLWLRYSK